MHQGMPDRARLRIRQPERDRIDMWYTWLQLQGTNNIPQADASWSKLNDAPQLSPVVRAAVVDGNDAIFVSAATASEIATKCW
jgi:hypothetical protein